MKLNSQDMQIILHLLDAEEDGFVALTRAARLDPQNDFQGADLKKVDFGEDNLSGFNFKSAHLEGAKLRRAHGLTLSMFYGVHVDNTTELPEQLGAWLNGIGFDVEKEATRLILAGLPIPVPWRKRIRKLDFRKSGMDDLKCLSALGNLQYLNLSETLIDNLMPLADVQSLEFLDVSSTKVSDLSPVSNLKRLRALRLRRTAIQDLFGIFPKTRPNIINFISHGNNPPNMVWKDSIIAGVDIRPSADLFDSRVFESTIKYLKKFQDVTKSELSDFSIDHVIPKNLLLWGETSRSSLQVLDLSRSSISDVLPLINAINLRRLRLDFTQVEEVASLAHLPQLRTLSLEGTPFSNTASLEGFKALSKLSLRSTRVKDLAPLANMAALRSLDIRGLPNVRATDLRLLRHIPEIKVDANIFPDLETGAP